MRFRNAETHRAENAGDFGCIIHSKFVLRKIAAIHEPFQTVEPDDVGLRFLES